MLREELVYKLLANAEKRKRKAINDDDEIKVIKHSAVVSILLKILELDFNSGVGRLKKRNDKLEEIILKYDEY